MAIEPRAFSFHAGGLLAHDVQPERGGLPDRAALDEPAYVLPPHERQMLAELLPEQVEQHAPVVVLLHRHLAEHLGAGGEGRAQALGEIGVDAAVLLLAIDGQCEDLAFAQFAEIAHWFRLM